MCIQRCLCKANSWHAVECVLESAQARIQNCSCERKHFVELSTAIRFYMTIARPPLQSGMECRAVKKSPEHKMQVAEMLMLQYISGFSRNYRTRAHHGGNLGVADIPVGLNVGD